MESEREMKSEALAETEGARFNSRLGCLVYSFFFSFLFCKSLLPTSLSPSPFRFPLPSTLWWLKSYFFAFTTTDFLKSKKKFDKGLLCNWWNYKYSQVKFDWKSFFCEEVNKEKKTASTITRHWTSTLFSFLSLDCLWRIDWVMDCYGGPLLGKIVVLKRFKNRNVDRAIGPWTGVMDGPLPTSHPNGSVFHTDLQSRTKTLTWHVNSAWAVYRPKRRPCNGTRIGLNPLRANYCHTWHMENHPFLWRRIRRVRRIQVCMARKGITLHGCFQASKSGFHMTEK